jgi:GT2 family glycosyltransferase
MQDRPKVVMIVLNYNSLKKLGERVLYFIRSIAYTNYSNFEMIVVDNGSIDGSDKLIEDELGRIGRGRVVKVEKNLGFTRGNNLGFELGCRSAKYVAFLNNDIEVEPDWLDKIIDVLGADESIAAAQPAILQLSNRNRVDSLGGMIDRFGWTYDLFSNSSPPNNLERPFEVFWAKAAAIVVRSDVFRKVGGFDEDYFIYYDEVDLCWRIRLLGYKVVTVPTARIYHLGGGTMGGANFRSIYMSRKNHLAMLLKNYSFLNAIFYSIVLVLIYLSAIVKEPFRGRKIVSLAVLAALVWNIRNLRKTLHKRAYIQSIRKIPDKQIQNYMFRIRGYKKR